MPIVEIHITDAAAIQVLTNLNVPGATVDSGGLHQLFPADMDNESLLHRCFFKQTSTDQWTEAAVINWNRRRYNLATGSTVVSETGILQLRVLGDKLKFVKNFPTVSLHSTNRINARQPFSPVEFYFHAHPDSIIGQLQKQGVSQMTG